MKERGAWGRISACRCLRTCTQPCVHVITPPRQGVRSIGVHTRTATRGLRPASHSKSKAKEPVLMTAMARTARSFTITCGAECIHHHTLMIPFKPTYTATCSAQSMLALLNKLCGCRGK